MTEENISQKIDHNDSRVVYKNHTLWLRSYELKMGGWLPKALVVIPQEEGNGERELLGESTLALREEADQQAFLMGKRWIDQKEAGQVDDKEIARG